MRLRVLGVFFSCTALAACGARSALERGEESQSPENPDAGAGGTSPAGCFTEIAARASSACALRADGALFCWGNNASTQLGMVTPGLAVPPSRVNDLELVSEVSMGSEFGCARTRAGLYCFGHRNFGQTGSGDPIGSRLPRRVERLPTELRGFSAGGTHACAIDAGGELYCWGNNGWGELGIGSLDSYPFAVPVALGDVSHVAAGDVHTCAVVADALLYCWGGRASEPSYPAPGPRAPVARGPVARVRKIAAGNEFTCVVSEDGWLGCMGTNSYVVRNTSLAALAAVDGLDAPMADVAGGWEHACAVAVDGSVSCWGVNRRGALGRDPRDGANPDPVPRRVLGIPGHAIAVAVGTDFSCALTDDGAVWCWGSQDFAQLGVVSEHPKDSPVPVRVGLKCE